MTERLYYVEPACDEFDATVTEVLQLDGRPAAVLDRTAFYPTSGGQPFDTGQLADVEVLETVDLNGRVAHVLSAPLTPGARVHGKIAWPRRFDHMQQHTGQHVLSAACERLLDNPTIGFHMGAEVSSIDLAREASWPDIERAVDAANEVVWADRPVSIRFASHDEAARLPLRKEPSRTGTLRLIDIEGFDLSACGGTHVASTGAIGLIAVLAAERLRGGSRLTFVCGRRALQALRLHRDAVAGSVRSLSVWPQDLPAAIERLQAELKDLRKAVVRQQEALAVHEAARLLADASDRAGRRVIAAALDGWDAPGLKAVAAAATLTGGVAVALLSSTRPAAVVVARSPDVGLDANAVVKELLRRFGGRGGGRAELAQGGGMAGDLEDMVNAARDLLAG